MPHSVQVAADTFPNARSPCVVICKMITVRVETTPATALKTVSKEVWRTPSPVVPFSPKSADESLSIALVPTDAPWIELTGAVERALEMARRHRFSHSY